MACIITITRKTKTKINSAFETYTTDNITISVTDREPWLPQKNTKKLNTLFSTQAQTDIAFPRAEAGLPGAIDPPSPLMTKGPWLRNRCLGQRSVFKKGLGLG